MVKYVATAPSDPFSFAYGSKASDSTIHSPNIPLTDEFKLSHLVLITFFKFLVTLLLVRR